MAQQPKQVRIDQLPPQQLTGLKQQLEEELQGLQQSAATLQTVASEFHQSGEAIQHLAEQKVGQPMLLPLSQSLYVEGELADADNVLLDIGTGYYLEKPLEGGVDYCKRKVNQMAENLQEISKVQQQKVQVLMAVESALQQRMQEAQQAAAKGGGTAVAAEG